MTKEIRHVIEKGRYQWSLDDVTIPTLELIVYSYIGINSLSNFSELNNLVDQIDNVAYILLSATAILLVFRRLIQLNSFVVLDMPLGMEGNFIYCLDKIRVFSVYEKEIDANNFCLTIKSQEGITPLPFWLNIICYENKVYINERPAYLFLSLSWNRNGLTKTVAALKALQVK